MLCAVVALAFNLFLLHRGGRYLIEPRENDFSLKGTRHFIPPEELRRIAGESPEQLSPNVILRPIAQDILLPTIAYVAGPAEVAYHAQLRTVYEALRIPQPIVYPRASASFVEERLTRALETRFWTRALSNISPSFILPIKSPLKIPIPSQVHCRCVTKRVNAGFGI